MISTVKVETLKDVRLNGKDIKAREIVEIDETLFKTSWDPLGLAKKASEDKKPPKEDGEKDETNKNNTTNNGASKSGRSKGSGKNSNK